MSLEKSDSIENKDMVEKVVIDIEINLESQPAAIECCIYRVPFRIRRMRADDYTPHLISIGPLYHGKVELADENKKKRYMKYFLDRTSSKKVLDEISTFITNNEQRIRHSYSEISKLSSLDYRLMVLYDSIFIIEFFLKYKSGDKSDLLLVIGTQRITLFSDLQLAENQLPYFVLEGIYEKYYLAMAGSDVPTFMELCCFVFSQADFKLNLLAPGETVKHFTDWKRRTILEGHPQEEPMEGILDLPCAMKLHESGVKFKSVKRECLLEVKFEKRKQGIPCFTLHELQITHFIVHPGTERLLRNILAFEQCHYPSDTRFCCYIIFLDSLIDTENDMDLLVGEGIISNHFGNNAVVANLFNNVCRNMTTIKSSYYPNIIKELKEHYNNPWNRAKATLKRVYFHNIWKGTATVAAVILLILTVTQTIFSILQVVGCIRIVLSLSCIFNFLFDDLSS